MPLTIFPGSARADRFQDEIGQWWRVGVDSKGHPTRTRESDGYAVKALTDRDFTDDERPDAPRMRRSLEGPVRLTDAWTTLRFGISGAFDQDTFPGGRYDEATDLIVAGGLDATANYQIEFYYELTAAALPTTARLRFEIPRPAGAGGPVYFPFPDLPDPYIDLLETPARSPWRGMFPLRLYFNELVRDYGIRTQMRTGGSVLAAHRPTMQSGALSLFPA